MWRRCHRRAPPARGVSPMQKWFTCPNGHRWEAAAGDRASAVLAQIVCPRCGAAGETCPPPATPEVSDTPPPRASGLATAPGASPFEAAWRAGQRPRIDDHLPASGANRQALLAELVLTDLEYRLKAGEPARVEEYLRRYPELAA